MTKEIARRLGVDGVTWETQVVDEDTAGGGSLAAPPEIAVLNPVATQEITNASGGTPIIWTAVDDEIGITDANGDPLPGQELRLPAGWYTAILQLYWEADAVGYRYATFSSFGVPNGGSPGSLISPGVYLTAAEYADLDAIGQGHLIGPEMFYVDHDTPTPNSSLVVSVIQTSGGGLDVMDFTTLQIRKLS